MLNQFIRFNRKLSKAVTPSHYAQGNVFQNFVRSGGLIFAQPDVKRVLDIGAGKKWPFPISYKSTFDLYVIGGDIDYVEMENNQALDEKVEIDATKSLAVPDGTMDVVMAYSGVEHFSDNQAFLNLAFKALRPGGFFIAQFPGSLAPFAILNKILPENLKLKIVHLLIPDSKGIQGFPAYYDNTRYSKFVSISKKAGFEIDFTMPGFFSASYFGFFFPLYVVAMLYDVARYALGVRDLASYNLFVLRKPGNGEVIAWQ